ncbi:MAG: hypothetical protein AAGE98_22220 [Actinomycetota bacterium]
MRGGRRNEWWISAVGAALFAAACGGGDDTGAADEVSTPTTIVDVAEVEATATDEITETTTTSTPSTSTTTEPVGDLHDGPVIPDDFDPTGEDFDRIYRELDDAFARALAQETTEGMDLVLLPESRSYERILTAIWNTEEGDVTFDSSDREWSVDSVEVYHRPADDVVVLSVITTYTGTSYVLDADSGEVLDEFSRDTTDGSQLHYAALERGADGGWRFRGIEVFGDPVELQHPTIPPLDELSVLSTETIDGVDLITATWEIEPERVCIVAIASGFDAAAMCPSDTDLARLDAQRLAMTTRHRDLLGLDLDVQFVIAAAGTNSARVSAPSGATEIPLVEANGHFIGAVFGDFGFSSVVQWHTTGSYRTERKGRYEVPCGVWTEWGYTPFDDVNRTLAWFVEDPTVFEDSLNAAFEDHYTYGETVGLRELTVDEVPGEIEWVANGGAFAPEHRFAVERVNPTRTVSVERWILQGSSLGGGWGITAAHRFRECTDDAVDGS